MARPLINSSRVLRTGAPLGLEAIRQVAPSVFAQDAHESRGPRYAYLPTIQPLQTLLDNGWGVYEASQQRARGTKDSFTKHMLSLRKMNQFYNDPPQAHIIRKDIPEVILINAHDGSAAYKLFAGVFRFICSNGLIVGSTMASFTVRHTVGPQTNAEVLAAGERLVAEQFPQVLDSIERFRGITLDAGQQYRLADRAVKLRYGDTVAPFETTDLLNCRREEDRDPTLWNMLNRIQENIMDGGWATRSALFGRASTVKPVERVSAVVKINGGLWDEAATLAKEVA